MDFSDQSIMKVAEKYDNLIVLKTCSKGVGHGGDPPWASPFPHEGSSRRLHSIRSPYNVNALNPGRGLCDLLQAEYIKNGC
jgi:histidinol-phosphate aminotransferase